MDNTNIESAAAALVQALAANNRPAVDVEQVEKIAGEVATKKVQAMAAAIMPAVQKAAEQAAANCGVRHVEVAAVADRPAVDLGVQHVNFSKLWQLSQVRTAGGCRLNIYLYGPAGTGKTTAAESVARGIYGNNDYSEHFHANGAISAPHELLGYMDAGGVYHETEFYKAFKNGGVYLFDELDSSSPAAVLAFNQALANGCAAFPCGMVRRHPDCVIIAGGNTCMRGDGAGSGFQRVRHDAAFRDRFVFLDWPIDEKLEVAVAAAYGEAGAAWCKDVQKMRAAAARVGVRDFEITPRATYNGAAMLAAGIERVDVLAACVRKGLGDDVWNKIVK